MVYQLPCFPIYPLVIRFYYLFGFLSLVLLIVLITCAEISIALTYFQLTSEEWGTCLVDLGVSLAFPGDFWVNGIPPETTVGRGLQMVVDLLLSQRKLGNLRLLVFRDVRMG